MAKKTQTKEHSLADLERFYREGDECDKELFAEQRSNLLLIAGEHYQKKNSAFYRRIRDNKDLSEQQKLRLTKNHIQKIVKAYVNNIVSLSPGVGVMPKNESEIQDQKSAEMNDAVWKDGCDRQKMSDLVDDFGDDFVGIGEVVAKVFFDPSAGKIKNYSQKMDDAGQPVFLDPQGNETNDPGQDPMTGQPAHQPAPGIPNYEGEIVIEPYYGFNVLRDRNAKDMKKSPFLILRKMVDKADLQTKFPEVSDKIAESVDDTVVVFDGLKGQYAKAKDQVLLKEIYFRPCPQYPRGYFFIYTAEAILAKGELPGGIFPIVFQAMDKIQTTPRGRSPVKTMRPYQAEINRSASKIAEHHVTLGDDKILTQNGTKLTQGIGLPGVRSINYTGMEPVILAGRDGSQYLNYMQAQIQELYQVMDMGDEPGESSQGQLDPYTLLFRAASQKKKFVRYVRRFESFQIEVARTYLELAKIHLSDDAVVYATGSKERVNIPEFRSTTELCYQIKLVPQAEDVETKLGKQLVINHALQYVGNKLEKEDIGKLIRAMPYSNVDESFDDLTLEYDAGTNMILALDRGERPDLGEFDNFVYLTKRLVARMRQADFKFKPPQIRMAYKLMVKQMSALEAQRQQAIQMAEQGFIPTGGYMVTVDLYVSDPTNPLKTRRARVPYQSLEWLIKKLETQGSSLSQLEQMNEGALAQIATQMNAQGGRANGMAPHPGTQGAEMPGGVSHGNGSSVAAGIGVSDPAGGGQ